MLLDLWLAVRSLRRSPGFAGTAILTIAIGIGASTALFSIVDAVLLRPLPFHEPERLVRLWESNPSTGTARADVSAANFTDWRQRTRAFEDLALFSVVSEPVVLGVDDGSVQTTETVATPNLFALLGVRPVLGREFGPLRERRGPLDPTEILISHALWQRVFAADASVIGRTIRIEGVPGHVVVGVMPPGFSFPAKTDFWTPLDVTRAAAARRDERAFSAVGRLQARATLDGARGELTSIAAALAREHGATNAGWTVDLMRLQDSIVGSHRLGLMTVFAAVAFVMLVGCANISNLLLARGIGRHTEVAVRAALGGSRRQIARLLLAESAVLAAAGATAGWLVAALLLPLFVQLAGPNVARLAEARLSVAALVYCAFATVFTAVVAGLVPALQLSRADLRAVISPDNHRSTGSRRASTMQPVIVAGQLAACLVLLVGAVLFAQTFVRLKGIDLGFDPAHVISIDARIPIHRTTARNRWQLLAADGSAVVERLRTIPGVQAAAAASDVPLSGSLLATEISLPGESRPRQALYHRVSPGYFQTMGMTLVSGRDFTHEDASDLARLPDPRAAVPRQGAVIVNETTARTFWPSGHAIGQYLSTSFDARISRRLVVGVVRDARSESLRGVPPAEVYVPYLEDPSFAMTLLVRTAIPADQLMPTLRREIREVTPDLSTANIRMLEDVVGESMASSRFSALLISAFALAALLLAAVGVFGVFAFGVASRFREIAIRLAIGASSADITRLFLTQAARTIAGGITLGTAGALAFGRAVGALLYGVAPADPASLTLGVVVLTAVAVVASYLPVRRAMRAEPAAALRA